MKRFINTCLFFAILMLSTMAFGQSPYTPPAPTGLKQPAPFSHWSIEATLGVSFCQGDDCDVDGGSMDAGPSFDLSAFYFFNRNIALGITLSGNSYIPTFDAGQPDEASVIISTFLLEGRVYLPLSETVRLFGMIGFGPTAYEFKVEEDGNSVSFDDDGTAFRIGAGFDVKINTSFSMGAVVYYQGNRWDKGEDDSFGYPSDWNVIQAGIRFIYTP